MSWPGRTTVGLASLAASLALWEALCFIGQVAPVLLPPPSQIAPALWSLLSSGNFIAPLGQTLKTLAIGYVIGSAAGVVAGLVLGCSRVAYGLLEPMIEVIRPLPKPALIPPMVLILGMGTQMGITMVGITVFFPVLINTMQGARGVDPVLLGTARTLGCSRPTTIRKIILPAALPLILTGMRMGLAMGLTLAVLSEMLITGMGIGFVILDLQRSFQIRAMYAWIAILAVTGLLLNAAFEQVEMRLVRWRAKEQ